MDNMACDCGKARGCTGNMSLMPIIEEAARNEVQDTHKRSLNPKTTKGEE